ncbi:hypothetical protein SMACR_00569 [Sordaria macrospora]|uniref:WGS project CABT00000000 data, contig 2.1 n=2 Tax=Sordaria macrospora TaxID=5147 RepID=F7VLH6_SORMK|nr:uncharacterized protein SMAC_00569 [Sordaria macrospora k-hell]KAA8635474.1 hypothetical protein SMACR_00569 [Sordaria macrospora]WPJ59320.1 hypothetical protein SMAC4_00569 [Sordaria macrospora]CCC06354.1 unnamed protein product [Sordaria macrospora k-hell]
MPPPEYTSKIPAPKGDARVGAGRKRQEKPASAAGPSFLPIWKALKKEQSKGLKSVVLTPSHKKKAKDKKEKEEKEGSTDDDKPPQVQGEGRQQHPSAPAPAAAAAAAAAADEGWVYVDEDVDWVVEIQPLKKKRDNKEEEWVAIVPISRE